VWTNKDVIEWLSTIKLGSKRSKYLTSITGEERTGEDLLELAADGKKNFVIEMEKNFGITSVVSRRMFKSLHALMNVQHVEESKSTSITHSRFTSELDPSDTPYQAPIYGVMDQPLMVLEKACKRLKGVVAHIDKIVGCAKETAAYKCKGVDSNGLTVDERAAINAYTQESPLYLSLNNALRARNRTKVVPFYPYLKLLLTALGKLPKVKGAFWRGVKTDLHTTFKEKMKSKQNHFFWSFKSTTLKADVLQDPMFLGTAGKRTLLNIHGFSGVRIEKYSSIQSEAEVLFPPGCCFTITTILNLGHELWMVELTEIKNKFPLIS